MVICLNISEVKAGSIAIAARWRTSVSPVEQNSLYGAFPAEEESILPVFKATSTLRVCRATAGAGLIIRTEGPATRAISSCRKGK